MSNKNRKHKKSNSNKDRSHLRVIQSEATEIVPVSEELQSQTNESNSDGEMKYPELNDSKAVKIINYFSFCVFLIMSPILGGAFAAVQRHRAKKFDEFCITYKPMGIIGAIAAISYILIIFGLMYMDAIGIIQWNI